MPIYGLLCVIMMFAMLFNTTIDYWLFHFWIWKRIKAFTLQCIAKLQLVILWEPATEISIFTFCWLFCPVSLLFGSLSGLNRLLCMSATRFTLLWATLPLLPYVLRLVDKRCYTTLFNLFTCCIFCKSKWRLYQLDICFDIRNIHLTTSLIAISTPPNKSTIYSWNLSDIQLSKWHKNL